MKEKKHEMIFADNKVGKKSSRMSSIHDLQQRNVEVIKERATVQMAMKYPRDGAMLSLLFSHWSL